MSRKNDVSQNNILLYGLSSLLPVEWSQKAFENKAEAMKITEKLNKISAQDLRGWKDEGKSLVLIDTLTNEHYRKVHLPQVVNTCVFEVTLIDEVDAPVGANAASRYRPQALECHLWLKPLLRTTLWPCRLLLLQKGCAKASSLCPPMKKHKSTVKS